MRPKYAYSKESEDAVGAKGEYKSAEYGTQEVVVLPLGWLNAVDDGEQINHITIASDQNVAAVDQLVE